MGTQKASHIFNDIYNRRYELKAYPDHRVNPNFRRYLARLRVLAQLVLNRWVLYTAGALVLLIVAASIYYYNLLVITEQHVLAARGKVDSLLQRRNDISINLSQAALDYAIHEREVFQAVVALRGAATPDGQTPRELAKILEKLPQTAAVAAGAQPGAAAEAANPITLPQLLAIAEQYPDLKLSNAFLNLMTALIEVEKDLSQERIRFNDMVNQYSTTVSKFPINIYSRLFGFKAQEYFQATEEAKVLQPIKF